MVTNVKEKITSPFKRKTTRIIVEQHVLTVCIQVKKKLRKPKLKKQSEEKVIKAISDFIFTCVTFLHYRCHKMNLELGGSYIGSPDWVRNKIATIHHKKLNQFSLNLMKVEKIRNEYQKISHQEKIPQKSQRKTIEKIPVNVLYVKK